MINRLTENCNVQSKKDLSLFGTVETIDTTDNGKTYHVLWDGYDESVTELASNLQVLQSEKDVLHRIKKAPYR